MSRTSFRSGEYDSTDRIDLRSSFTRAFSGFMFPIPLDFHDFAEISILCSLSGTAQKIAPKKNYFYRNDPK
ncbi:hypothetical protein CH375_09975 [Leptospira ellisii]|uniref:Uncharacterized protein n=1 Tax=Leptospira ellisii TaxID=2023197 RepID=A0A2N0B5J8_9LEPT|nr:hypothetical protein CH379_16455 [Leptospira ellisii]PKA04591.1 hypothetical protein CH375_09975 [Leptospira ellisii]